MLRVVLVFFDDLLNTFDGKCIIQCDNVTQGAIG